MDSLGFAGGAQPDATVNTWTEIADIPELAEHLSIAARICLELRTGRKTVNELAEALGTTAATVRAKLNGTLRDEVVNFTDGTWGLVKN